MRAFFKLYRHKTALNSTINPADPNSHSLADHTQPNWNGMIGKLLVRKCSGVSIDDVQIYPDVEKKLIVVRGIVKDYNKASKDIWVEIVASSSKRGSTKLPGQKLQVSIEKGTGVFEKECSMGGTPLLWSEFNPNLYNLQVSAIESNQKLTQKSLFLA